MRTLFLALVAMVGVNAQAGGSSGQVNLSAQSASQTIQLIDQTFEPIYESQPYQATCSREVFDHTETTCQTVNDSVCHGGGEVCQTVNDSVCHGGTCTNVPRRVCHNEPQTCTNVPRRVCSDHSIFRTEYYGCTQYHDVVVGQRLVKTFNHQVEVAIANPALLNGANLSIEVDASNESLSARLLNSFSGGLLNYQISVVSENDSGAVLNRSEKILIDLAMSAADLKLINSASIDGLQLGQNACRFNLRGLATISDRLNISIVLVRHRAIFANTTLYNGTVDSSKLGLVGQGSDIQALIPYQKLNISSINSLKYDLSISVKLNPGSAALLNAGDFQAELNRHLDQGLNKVNPSF